VTPPKDVAARQRAVTETAVNVVVSAGAGTGKTSLIVERLLVAIGDGAVPLRSIAAITFTEKAAGELRFRLAEGLEELARLASGAEGSDSPARRALLHLTRGEAGSVAEIAARCRQAALHLDRATVTTIHGFCTEILRGHPIEANLPPAFRVDRGPASLRAAREEWARFLEDELGPEARREDVWRAALTALGASELERLGRDLARGAIPSKVLGADYRAVDSGATLGARAGELAEGLRALRGTKGLTPAPVAWIDEAIAVLDRASRGDVAGARRAFEDAERLDKPLEARTRNVDRQEGKRVEALARGALDLIRATCRIDEPAVTAAITAVLPYARALRDRLERAGLVDFDTLLVATRDLLRDNLEVREAQKARFAMILVDEFQDTDPLQYEIVFFLAEQAGGGANDAWAARLCPGRLFIVGDAKQSIYRFRGADYGAYTRAVARVREQGGIELSLTANFRSVPGILGPINTLGGTWTRSDHLPDYEPIGAERDDAHLPAVEIWTTPAGSSAADERRRGEGRAIAAEIRALHEAGTPYGDILILLRGFTNVPLYLRELREAGIPFVASGGKSFYEHTEIVQALGVLRAVADPEDPIARLAYLRSAAGAVPDAELVEAARTGAHPVATPTLHAADAKLAALRSEVAAIPVDVAVRYVLERTGLFALGALGFEGAQRVANLEKLATDASEFARDGRLSLLELIDALAERPRGEDEGDSPLADESGEAVRVMTIHKAKGLEAPIVILADGAAGRNLFGEREWKVGIARSGGEERLLVEGPKFTNTAFAICKLENRPHEDAEDVRLLYVALTRARERLIVIAGTTQNRPSRWMDALKAWGYDAKVPPADGTGLHAGAVRFRVIDPPESIPPAASGIPEGAPGAVERYLAATRVTSSAAEFRTPSAGALPDSTFTGPTIDAELARAVGVAVHAHFARISERDTPPEAVAAEVRAILARFEGSPLSKRLASLEEICREIPILYQDPGGTLWRGSIDLLGREPDGTLVVIDYKTDAELEGAAARREPQLAVYVDAVSKAVPGSRVRAELWMLRHGQAISVHGGAKNAGDRQGASGKS